MRVGLVVEGTYPYVTGGVSGWLHSLIAALPHVRFTVLAIVSERKSPGDRKYPRLPNVDAVIDIPFLGEAGSAPRARRPSDADWTRLVRFHETIKEGAQADLASLVGLVADPRTRSIDLETAMHGRRSYDALCAMYQRYAGDDIPFLDYFWTWRSMHLPLLRILQTDVPPCDVYHSLCTGYAGLLASVHRMRTGAPFLLTEHGIYSSERRDELWELQFKGGSEAASWDLHVWRWINRWWERLFSSLARISYRHADRITTIADCSRALQIGEGADGSKIEVIWGGIDVERLRATRRVRPGPSPDSFTVALVGRVVPVKDVKNFLEMGAILLKRLPRARLLVVGPLDHDERYQRECRRLASALGLEACVAFTGEMNVAQVFEKTDVLVVSSLREVVPRVILEANGCGIPVVATDVGACREMLEGRTPEDRRLGPSGVVVPLGDAGELARAVASISRDPARWRAMSRAGLERVERYYDERTGWKRYAEIYEELAARQAAG